MSARLFSLFVVLLAAVAFGGHDEVPVWNEAQRAFFSMSPAERRAKFTDEDFRKGIVFKTTEKGAWRPSGPGETSRFVRLGTIPNMRDFGGLVGLGGRRFRSGVLYRSAGLNSNAPYRTVTNAQGKAEREYYGRGAERLDAAARAFAITNLGIRTDLDLRGPGECREMTGSPLGPGVKWIRTTFRSYGGLFTPDGKASFREAFAVLLDERNYPIDFHCIAGADRTGTLAYVIEALCGVDDATLLFDWELTALANSNVGFAHEKRYDRIVAGFAKYPGATTRERVSAFVREQGFSDRDIDRLRAILLEEEPSLRFGVISDSHATEDTASVEPLRRIFRHFAAEGVDAVVHAGDIGNAGTLAELRLVRKAWDEAFPNGTNAVGRPVVPFFVFGNHDYHKAAFQAGKTVSADELAQAIFAHKDEAFRLIAGTNFPGEVYSRTVRGYTFVGACWQHEGEVGAFLKTLSVDPTKPLFYVQHPHPKRTCFGDWTSGTEDGREALLGYPNLFAMSGHSHISVADDRGLWQGGFVSMGVGSAGGPGPGRRGEFENGNPKSWPEGTVKHMRAVAAGKAWQASVVTVYPDRLTVDRRDFFHGESLGATWTIGFPFRHDAAHPYLLADAAAAPEFPAGAALSVSVANGPRRPDEQDERQLVIRGPAAVGSGPFARVTSYRVSVVRRDGSEVRACDVLQDGIVEAESRAVKRGMSCAFALAGLPEGEPLAVCVVPRNTSLREGRPLRSKAFAIEEGRLK